MRTRWPSAARDAPLAVVNRLELQNSVARGIALFVGGFSALNTLAVLASGRAGQDLWWIDLRGFSTAFSLVVGVGGALLLLAFGVRPRCAPARARATAVAAALLGAVAVSNADGFYDAWRAGSIDPRVPYPFSLVVAGALSYVALVAWSAGSRARPVTRSASMVATGVALACALAFPLAQVWFFGGTEYRRPADAAVVLGARVCDDGRLSWTLQERVDTAVELYASGRVRMIVMSGGTGSNGVDEAAAMRRHAVASGVPMASVVCDHNGTDTDATVRNTVPLLREIGATRVIAVSHFYHLPRIKMAYRAEGLDVLTVPAVERREIVGTPRFMAREIPGFWVYWARSWWRAVTAT